MTAARVLAVLALTSCAPSYDGAVADRLASVGVAARQMADGCPAVAGGDVRDRLLFPVDVAAASTRYRTNAVNVARAVGEVRGMVVDLAARGAMSPAYCRAKLGDIADGVDRVLRTYEGL